MSILARLCAAIGVSFLATFALAGSDLKPEEVLQRHLNSIGSSEARTTKSRVMEGRATYKLLVGGSGQIEGKSVMVSEGDKLHLLLKINALKYHGEKFLRNGEKTFVAGTYDDGSRSEFGEFLRSEDLPLREGLLGGTLSTGWPLLDFGSRRAKLHCDGLKKVDGRELYAVSYQPSRTTDLDVTLYFEPETFRHVMTVYKASVHAGIGARSSIEGLTAPGIGDGREVASARQQQTRYRIEERFSDFETVDGLTLPSHYDLRYQQELQSGFTKLVEWDIYTMRILNNISLDPRNFEIH